MDMSPTNTSTNTASTNSPEPETETPTRILPPKPLSFTNGVLKRHSPHHLCSPAAAAAAAGGPVAYKKCLKNHAASLGGYAIDGCGEFIPSRTAKPSDPTSLECVACGCHRNFHRREPDDRTVFKVWMHSNKNTFGKGDVNGGGNSNVNSLSLGNNATIATTHHNRFEQRQQQQQQQQPPPRHEQQHRSRL